MPKQPAADVQWIGKPLNNIGPSISPSSTLESDAEFLLGHFGLTVREIVLLSEVFCLFRVFTGQFRLL